MKALTVLFITFCLAFDLLAQKEITVPYDFPVRPGSAKWASFSTSKEMLDACQIPDTILNALTTKALAETCLDYPLYFLHTASADERKAIDNMIDEFNGLHELSLRADGFAELAKLYKAIPVIKQSFLKSKAEDVPYKTIYLELLLANKRFFAQASSSDLQDLRQSFLANYTKKLGNQKIHSLYSVRKTLLLGAMIHRQLNVNKPTPSDDVDKVAHFIDCYDAVSPDKISEISQIVAK